MVNVATALVNSVLITFAKLAEIKGCSKAAITKATKGRIADAVVEQDGKRWLDRDKALELWDRNTLRTHNAKVGHVEVLEPPVPRDAKDLRQRVNRLPDDAIPDLNESRARREHYQAELAKLQVTQQRGDLVPVTEVKKEAFALGRSVREALANLADRLSHQLAGETDPTKIHRVLSEEHRMALAELADG